VVRDVPLRWFGRGDARSALADHESQASQRVAEELPVRIDERRSAVAACHELLSQLTKNRVIDRQVKRGGGGDTRGYRTRNVC
jgi:hypothetical protein